MTLLETSWKYFEISKEDIFREWMEVSEIYLCYEYVSHQFRVSAPMYLSNFISNCLQLSRYPRGIYQLKCFRYIMVIDVNDLDLSENLL